MMASFLPRISRMNADKACLDSLCSACNGALFLLESVSIRVIRGQHAVV
jgi:hypothetical protein